MCTSYTFKQLHRSCLSNPGGGVGSGRPTAPRLCMTEIECDDGAKLPGVSVRLAKACELNRASVIEIHAIIAEGRADVYEISSSIPDEGVAGCQPS